MRYLAAALLVLFAAAMAGSFLIEDPGFVVIGYRGQALRTSFALFVLVLGLLMLVLYALIRLLARLLRAGGSVSHWVHRRRHQRAEHGLRAGLTALSAGNWRGAERQLVRAARASEAPLLHYLGAARAAQAQSAAQRRDAYLRLAHEHASADDQVAVELARAELALEAGDPALAGRILEALAPRAADNPRLLTLLMQRYRAAGAWAELLDLLPRLARHRVLERPALARLEHEVCQAFLESGAAAARDPEDAWARVPRRLRDDPALVAAHTRNLAGAGRGAQAEQLLRRAIQREWTPELVELYGHIEGADPGAQLDVADGWARARPQDPALLLTRGRLSHRAQLWGKARACLEAALAERPEPQVYALLVDTLTRAGDPEAAGRYAREGLSRVAASGAAPALPAPQVPA